ncbi:substrate-binding domain-containing protein [Roseisalinus antarcticus]|uniref:D-ribose-binding periplasmic protein n=1 Tax=Roseisalinus antarcticus TaxID=254357 RepID=A0A1Y5TE81_9RHOB|nr:D-ribose-binding periplasmic protein precursor [Roseisalinus antarcticus]
MTAIFKGAVCAAAMAASLLSAGIAAAQDRPIVGFITKTEGNPFFVAMRLGAEQMAEELDLDLRSFAARSSDDNESQVQAIENLIAAGAIGIAIVPNDEAAIVPAVERAREAGLLVISLNTALVPAEAADATFTTDNRAGGILIGEWARAHLGDAADTARIAMLDAAENQGLVDVERDQGFMEGFGIDVKDPNRWGDEEDERICGHAMTLGSEAGGRTAMETLLQQCPDITVVYTVNEPAAAGAYQALRAVGKDDGSVTIVSFDGGCPGVADVADGVIGATTQQYPLLMASMALEAIKEFAETGERPEPTPGLDFFNTGTTLVTDAPVDGVESIDTTAAMEICWG